ncbi:MAG TPA: hypothetical protein VN840_12530 [Streptosporangiaceae bacterium]|nr:hypothetical protein [Streptosporangiaceae bacterium]
MARTAQIPRSRGGLSGLILILLGAWGGLIPLVGHYFKYGFTPDRAWELTQGRLYLSVIPGAAALLAGLVIMMTRSRAFGGFMAFVAALAGLWFIVGAAVVRLLPASLGGSISTGTPIAATASRVILTSLGFYAGTGALIMFFAALALGRFSIAPAREHARLAEELAGGAGAVGLAGAGALAFDAYAAQPTQSYSPAQSPYPAGPGTFPQSPDSFGQSPDTFPQEAFQAEAGQYPASPAPYLGSQETETYQPGGPAPYVSSQDPFPGSHDPYSSGQGQ